jgi:cobalt-zinc-cadmium efflux system outer membrane protein
LLVWTLAAARTEAAEAPLGLAELERLALERNPTIAQARAAVDAAEGRRQQVTRFPNPTLAYEGEDLRKREFVRGDHHTGLLGFDLPLGGRLGKAGAVAGHEKAEATFALEAQKQRVRNAVRSLHTDLLVARGAWRTREDLARIAAEAVAVSEELYNVGQADRPDVLAVAIESSKAKADVAEAAHHYEERARALAAVVGEPGLDPARITGDLAAGDPGELSADLAELLAGPEAQAARSRAERERASVDAARALRFGDPRIEVGYGYDYDTVHGLGGWTWQVRVALPLPLFDRAQGRTAEARGRAEWAAAEARRLELSLGARLATEKARYAAARERAATYRQEVLPRAEEAVTLYEAKFKDAAAAYPQVLIARRALAQARLEYLEAQGRALHHRVRLEGFLLEGGLARPGAAPPGEGDPAGDADAAGHAEAGGRP